MRHTRTKALLAAGIAFLVTMSALPGDSPRELRGEALMRALKSGGYTILVRHARTDRTIPTRETPGSVPPLRADQRNLTAAGEEDVQLMRAVVEKYALPISEVLTSPLYRCRETADAFGAATTTMTLRTFPTTAETADLVARRPKDGTNRVLVTHHFVIENHVPGISPGDIDESEAAVVRSAEDGKVVLVGRIKLGDWQALAGNVKRAETVVPSSFVHHGAVETGEPVAIPPTKAGRLAAAYLKAFNSGDAATMRSFIETSLVPSHERPTDVRVKAYTGLFSEHGAITPTALQTSTEEKVSLLARSKRGNLMVTVTASSEHPDRAQSVTVGLLQGGPGH